MVGGKGRRREGGGSVLSGLVLNILKQKDELRHLVSELRRRCYGLSITSHRIASISIPATAMQPPHLHDGLL
jgi:hypothetical protein